jgi:hypothetical protein
MSNVAGDWRRAASAAPLPGTSLRGIPWPAPGSQEIGVPFTAQGPRNFMPSKAAAAGDQTAADSLSFPANATQDAENVLTSNSDLVGQYATRISELTRNIGKPAPPEPPGPGTAHNQASCAPRCANRINRVDTHSRQGRRRDDECSASRPTPQDPGLRKPGGMHSHERRGIHASSIRYSTCERVGSHASHAQIARSGAVPNPDDHDGHRAQNEPSCSSAGDFR